MLKRWLGLCAVVAFAIPMIAQDAKKDDAKEENREEQVKELVAKFKKEYSAAMKEAAPKTQADFDAAKKKFAEGAGKNFLPEINKLLEAKADDAGAGDLLEITLVALEAKDKTYIGMLKKNFTEGPTAQKFVQMFSRMTAPQPWVSDYLETVADKNKDDNLKGAALFALGNVAYGKADKGDKTAAAAAKKYFARLEKEFPEARINPKAPPFATQAKSMIFEMENLAVGCKAPTTPSKNLKGEKVSLADYKGKVVVLDIWATWCGPCRAMIPHEREMVGRLKDKPFALISISCDDKQETLDEFLKKEEMPWTHWFEGRDGEIIKGWNIRFFPTIYIIDAEGVIRHKGLRGDAMEKAVEKLIEEIKQKNN